MQSIATAGIDFEGSIMRYAEIETFGSRQRLLRLGDCDFEFDVSTALFDEEESRHLDVISDALAEVFHGTSATSCRVAVSAPWTRSFATPAVGARVPSSGRPSQPETPERQPGAVEPSEQDDAIAFESVLLHGGQSHHRTRRFIAARGSHGAASDSASTPESIRHGHDSIPVFEIPGRIVRRIDSVAAGLGDLEIDVLPDAIAVARLIERIHAQDGQTKRMELVIGMRSAGTDYTLVDGPRLVYHQSRSERESGDVVYFAVRSLELALVDLRDVARVSLYGTNANESVQGALARVFGSGVRFMDPVAMLDLDADRFEPGFPFEAFAVCLGAAL